MKKIKVLLTSIIVFAVCLTVKAQFKQIAEGPSFEEPEEGFAKILQLKNGSTFYMHFTTTDEINIRIYDPGHVEKKVAKLNAGYGELKNPNDIEAVFEVNNEVVVFLNLLEDHVPNLYRLIIDAANGRLKKKEIIATSEKKWKPAVFVRKDLYSDNYAVAIWDFRERDNKKRIEMIHYGSDHNKISRQFCITPEEDKARSDFIDMVVMGSDKVCAFLSIPRPKNIVINTMATLEKGKSDITLTDLKLPDLPLISSGISRYDPFTKKILFLAINPGEKDGEYLTSLFAVDPQTGKGETLKGLGFSERLHASYNENFDTKKGYQGMPQDLIINDDGSFTILNEELMYIQQANGNGTELGKIAVSNYDNTGKLLSDYLIFKSSWVYNTNLEPLYVSDREIGCQQLFKGNQFKSFAYINGIKNKYIVFNDAERNNNIQDEKMIRYDGGLNKGRLIMVQGITGNCDAFIYKLSGNDILPKREYKFGKKETGHTLAIFTVADYNSKTNTYVTLKLDKGSINDKMVKLIWEVVE